MRDVTGNPILGDCNAKENIILVGTAWGRFKGYHEVILNVAKTQ